MIELLPAGSWGDLATNQRLDQAEMAEFQTAIRAEMGGFRVELGQMRVEMHRSARQAMAVNTAAMLAIGGMLVAALRI
ncbi:MAG: hypothetical protein OEY41_16930 [Acidimicrobiia bacterium]|nr:hypothetical protein [Acidimicrobiia bacterium]MDH5291681.1 hypothetical protein [Acidimicrobiia bacterium]